MKKKITSNENFFNKTYLIPFSIEVLFALIHPNIFLKGKKIKTKKNYYFYSIEYEINDILCLITLSRIYVIFRYVVSKSKYYTSISFKLS